MSKLTVRPVLICIGCAGLIATAAFGVVKGISSSTASVSAKAEPSPQFSGGMRVSIDPVTGLPAPVPTKGLPDAAAAALFDSSHAGLVEEPGKTRAGGFKVNAQGRFHSSVAVEIDQDGKPTTRCVAGDAAAHAVATVPLASRP